MDHMKEVFDSRNKIKQSLSNKVNSDADYLTYMVDELSERATDTKGQGMTLFLQTRKDFIHKVESLRSEYLTLLCQLNVDR